MKIYDCFTFFDEKMLLNFRLNYLDKFVDKFVIAEAAYTHSGNKKKINFNINDYPKFKHKIIFLPVYAKPKNLLKIYKKDSNNEIGRKLILNGCSRENFHRNYLGKALKSIDQEDIIIISDIDEIPNLENISFKNINNKVIFFKQFFLFYKFNLLYKKKPWYGSRACRKKHFISAQWLRNVKSRKYSIFRPDIFFSNKKYNDVYFINKGGWHFTNIKTPKEIYYKFSNYLHHQEFEDSNLKLKDIKRMISKKIALYNHEVDQRKNKFDGRIYLSKISKKNLPDYLIKNLTSYKKWLA
jgi:beta-1,4-mannosyl-glycoprotein beta-1,4-N-acetylglucosaminyltransferase